MKINPTLLIVVGMLLPSAFIFSGCQTNTPENRAVFQNISINGQPMQLILDTGAPTSALTGPAATRLGVKFTPLPPEVANQVMASSDMTSQGLSEPVHVTMGPETVTVQIPVNNQLSWLQTGFIGDNREIDGLIGWSDLADNILVFDGAQHTISGVATLPEETSNWTKLKIHPAAQLLLEAPLTDGNTGLIFVDTASPLGVTLPPTAWKVWRAQFPHTQWIDNTHVPPVYKTSISDVWKADDRMADEITLGPITLTSVPAHLAWPAEMAPFPNNYAGSLGLAALARMDLVVDGKAGFAYLRPKPAPTPAEIKNEAGNSPVPKGDWTVEGSLQLKGDHLLAASGALKSESGDFTGAVEDFSRALELDPNSAEAYRQRGDAKEKNGDDAAAITDLNQALELDAKNVQAYLDRGKARQNNGDVEGAVADFSQAIELDPGNPAAYFRRAGARDVLDDLDGVIADYTRVLELEPKNVKRRDAADYTRMVNAYLNRAIAEEAKGDFNAAFPDYTHAIALIPNSPVGYEYRAGARHDNGDFDGAIADYTRILQIDSTYVEACFGRAKSKTFKGDYTGAMADFDQGFKFDPQNNTAYLMRGLARECHGDFTGALADFDKAIALRPDNSPYAYLSRQLLLRRLGRASDDFPQIVAKFESGWIKTLGEYLAGELDETALLAAADQKSQETASVKKCDAFYFIGMMRLFNGDPAGARENWQRAMDTHDTADDTYLLARAEIARWDGAKTK